MLTTLSILSRDQGTLHDHRANEEAYLTRYVTPSPSRCQPARRRLTDRSATSSSKPQPS